MQNYSELRKKIIGGCIDAISEEIISKNEWKDVQTSPLGTVIPASEIKMQFKESIKSLLLNIKEEERMVNGLKIIEDHLNSIPYENICRKEMNRAAKILFDHLLEASEKFEKEGLKSINTKMLKPSQNGRGKEAETLGEVLDFSPAAIAAFYDIGASLFKEDKLEPALSVFLFLSMLDPYRYEIWVSQGLAYQGLKEWFSAIHSFSIATLLNPNEMIPYICTAECYLACNDHRNAKGSLLLAKHFLKENDRVFKNKINELLEQV